VIGAQVYRGVARVPWVIALAAMTTACAAPVVKPENMVPSIARPVAPVSSRTLEVARVTGGERSGITMGGPHEWVRIDNDGFKEALSRALQQAGLFTDVIKNGDGDYALTAEIAAQGTNRVGFITYTAQVLVTYTLIDKNGNNELWRERIFSQHTADGEYFRDSFEGASRKANEGAVKDNLSHMIEALASFMRSRP
jgi:ABC-type uncharacterized transport system auxiliary subunit